MDTFDLAMRSMRKVSTNFASKSGTQLWERFFLVSVCCWQSNNKMEIGEEVSRRYSMDIFEVGNIEQARRDFRGNYLSTKTKHSDCRIFTIMDGGFTRKCTENSVMNSKDTRGHTSNVKGNFVGR